MKLEKQPILSLRIKVLFMVNKNLSKQIAYEKWEFGFLIL